MIPGMRPREEFIKWQCRIRQRSVREHDGRPSPGMRPRVLGASGEELAAAVTLLIVESDPSASTAYFQHQFRRTNDAAERRARALERLAAEHFQDPALFSDAMTALFGPGSPLARRLLAERRCVLEFAERGKAFRLACDVAELAEGHPFHRATYWHNHLFNPNLPPGIRILSFAPDWAPART